MSTVAKRQHQRRPVPTTLALWCCLVALVARAGAATEIRHLQLNNAHLVETSPSNYGLAAPLLAQVNWRTVSVNGPNLIAFTPQCQQVLRQTGSLTDQESSVLLQSRRQLQSADSQSPQMLGGAGTTNNQYASQVFRSAAARYSLNGQSVASSFSRNLGLSNFHSNGVSITRYNSGGGQGGQGGQATNDHHHNDHDDDNFSIGKPGGLPNGIVRVFVADEVVTYVYGDGQVAMKPAGCLQAAEQQLVQQLRLEVQQAEAQFQASMLQFQQSMAQMQSSLQQNMQSMRDRLGQNMQNLNGMFQQAGHRNQGPRPQYPQQQQQQQQQVINPAANNYNGAYPSQPIYQGQTMALPLNFGNSFPFGPQNSPFGPQNSPFGANFPFGGR